MKLLRTRAEHTSVADALERIAAMTAVDMGGYVRSVDESDSRKAGVRELPNDF